jgi:Phytanoyl-CoA dioxygenase (PhyH)
LIDLLSNQKSFRHRWIGALLGNRLGLHSARVHLADLCAGVRRGLLPAVDHELEHRLRRDGLIAVEKLLPQPLFEQARDEFRACLRAQAERVPVPAPNSRGFGAPIPNAWGFDRYDGGSLNRFVRIGDETPLLAAAFAADGAPARLLRRLCGTALTRERLLIYQLIHGPESKRPDLQRKPHCDTFHETFKLWYFFDDVTLQDGPLLYSPGSHRNSRQRLRWERERILHGRVTSSAFRITHAQLQAFGCQVPQPVLVRANTLVLANTRGFHCRGMARAGTERSCVYANLRPHAFGLRAR